MEYRCKFAGFGGQGIISMGMLAAYAGMIDGKQVTFFPEYGIAMRGGMANCTVIVSDEAIASPVVARPNVVVAMNDLSFDGFQPQVAPGGTLVVNSSLIKKKVSRPDIKALYINATVIALENGDGRMANMVMLGGLLKATGMISLEAVDQAMVKTFPAKLQRLIGKNQEVLRLGYESVK
ncbi:MAG: 2-oxoacid:acceptor oxidoreductase family protein [Fibrobacterota bacterium]